MADEKVQKKTSDDKPAVERRCGRDRRVENKDRRGDERVETEIDPRRSGAERRKK